jgi:hypothetical protein
LNTLWAATSDEIEEGISQGCYFIDPGQLGKESDPAQDVQLGENLHNLSEKLVREKLGPDGLL